MTGDNRVTSDRMIGSQVTMVPLERPNNRGLCSAGKRQAAALEQQRLMTRGLGGSCREGFGAF